MGKVKKILTKYFSFKYQVSILLHNYPIEAV